MAVKRIGRQDPTHKFTLPYRKSRYREAVALYNLSGRKAQKWQTLLLKDVMSVGGKGLWRHVKFGYSLPRRNGKNEVIVMREFWGLVHGENILHTAHRTSTSHAAWERLCRILTLAGYQELGRKKKDEDPPEKSFKTSKKYGLETIQLTGGGVIHFRTRTETGGLGEGFDLLVIDEAQEYTPQQESTLKYMVSDSKNPQTLLCGTPNTMVSAGTVFSDLRDRVLAGNGYESGWAEWGVDREPEDITDKELWYQTNPSLGTILTPRDIQAEIGTDTLDFVIQRFGYWFKYSLKSAITLKEWEALRCETLPELKGPLCVGVKFGKDHPSCSVSVAVRTWDDRILIEAIDCRDVRDGTSWVLDFLTKAQIETVVIDGASGASQLSEEMRQLKLRKPVLPTVPEVIEANAQFEQMIADGKLCHMGQPSLTQIASNCEHRAIGSKGGYGYSALKEADDVGLLDSVIFAAWAQAKRKEKRKMVANY